MNIFDKIMREEMTIGNPLRDKAAIERRLNNMSLMTKGKGFRTPPSVPITDGDGKTRGQRKRERHERAFRNVA